MGIGHWQRGEPEPLLRGEAEWFSAGGQHCEHRTVVEERGDDVGYPGQEVLAVVDDEQLWPGGEEGGAGR